VTIKTDGLVATLVANISEYYQSTKIKDGIELDCTIEEENKNA
jgi:hypothetical protein